MIEEIRKRPFIRPLFLWIAGTLLQLTVPDNYLPVLFLFFPCVFLSLTYYFDKTSDHKCCYNFRWTWGLIFTCLLVALSMLVTAGAQRQDSYSEPNTIRLFAIDKQSGLVNTFDCLRLTNEEKSVLATITLGYKQSMNPRMKKNFSIAGVAHLLAVSGFHVAVVCGFLSLVLGVLPENGAGRWVRYILMMILLWGYVCITGMAASSVRAGCMLSLYLTGKALRCVADSYNILAAAAFGMLVYDPFYLFDIGFQLSYIAVFFILYLQPSLKKLIDVRNPVLAVPWDWVTITIAAQTGTVLLCLYYFGQSSSVFLLTNLPLTLIATLLIPMSLLWLVLPQWLPGFDWLQQSVEILTRWMVKVVDAFSYIRGAAFTVQIDFFQLIICYGFLLSLLFYIRMRRPAWLLVSLSILLIMLLAGVIKRYYAS